MGDGLAKRPVRGPLGIYVYPLVVAGCISEEVDTRLVYLQPVAVAQVGALCCQ